MINSLPGSGPPAFVLSFGGGPYAYDLVRALGVAGIPSIVATYEARNIAFRSRHCLQSVVLPDRSRGIGLQTFEALRTAVSPVGGRPPLFYVSDPELEFVREWRDQLQKYFRFLLPDEETLENLFNKVQFVEFARRHELPTPFALCFQSAKELASSRAIIPFPCIVKPAFSNDWEWETDAQLTKFGTYKQALRRFSSMSALQTFCDALPERNSGFLVQKYVDGPDDAIASFHGYFDEKSVCLASFVGRKIRTFPPRTGGSVYIRTIMDSELRTQSIDLLQRIGFRGIVKIDYKWDARDDCNKMLEINPRYNLWEMLGAYAGANLAAIAYYHQLNIPMTAPDEYQDNLRLLFVKQDVRACFTGYRKFDDWSFRSYLRSLRGKKIFRIFDRGDPLPFAASFTQFIARNVARISRSKQPSLSQEDGAMHEPEPAHASVQGGRGPS